MDGKNVGCCSVPFILALVVGIWILGSLNERAMPMKVGSTVILHDVNGDVYNNMCWSYTGKVLKVSGEKVTVRFTYCETFSGMVVTDHCNLVRVVDKSNLTYTETDQIRDYGAAKHKGYSFWHGLLAFIVAFVVFMICLMVISAMQGGGGGNNLGGFTPK